jgi:hypothetical protein
MHPFWEGFYALFATDKPWTIDDLALQGEADVKFDPDFQWHSLSLNRWSIESGLLVNQGTLTNLALPELKISGVCERDKKTEQKTASFAARGSDWQAILSGHWIHAPGKPGSGEFEFKEENVPLSIHPQREALSKTPSAASGRVTRQRTAHVP